MQKAARVAKAPQAWWSTRLGRSTSMYLLTAGAGLAGAAHFLPDTALKDLYLKQVALYKEAAPYPVEPEIQRRLEESMEIAGASPVMKRLIRPFTVFGFDLFSIGSTNSRQGLEIGIPINYYYKTESDIDKVNLRVNNEEVDWGTEAAEKLVDSLIIPEDVQIFGFCREILSHSNYQLYLNTTYAMLPFLFGRMAGANINERFQLFSRPAGVRYTIYGLLYIAGFGIYSMCMDLTQSYFDKAVDKELCELDPDFARRGVIFYDKMLKRNMALREIMGEAGRSQFNSRGDRNFLFRQREVPLTARKKFFESKLKEPADNQIESNL